MIEHFNLKFDSYNRINLSLITKMLNHKYRAKFSLLCAEDCLKFVTKEKKDACREALDRVYNWLVFGEKLKDDVAISPGETNSAFLSSSYALWSAKYNLESDPSWCSYYAAISFQNEFDKKMREYFGWAKLFLTKTTFIGGDLPKTFLTENCSVENICALIDHLLEEGENIILFISGKHRLNLPEEIIVENSCMSNLINTICSKRELIEYLKHLYT